jgi:polyphosphate glucokinase
VLDLRGKPLSERVRTPTPKNATPKALLGVIRKLAKRSGEYDRVAVGFPGVVKDGLTYTAPNLGKGWKGYKLEQDLSRILKAPTRVANDADVQGLGCVSGRGIELVITLGTGVGSVLFADGQRIHLELAHHPFHKGKSYEDELGHRALLKKGKGKWNKLLLEAVADLKGAFNYDRLYLGGGDSKFIKVKLPGEVTIVSNVDGLLGAIALWKDEKPPGQDGPTEGCEEGGVGRSFAEARIDAWGADFAGQRTDADAFAVAATAGSGAADSTDRAGGTDDRVTRGMRGLWRVRVLNLVKPFALESGADGCISSTRLRSRRTFRCASLRRFFRTPA